ncbi:outer membrane protein assembly factor BamA [Nitratifractor sp.]
MVKKVVSAAILTGGLSVGAVAASLPKIHAPIADIEIDGIGNADKILEFIGLKKGQPYSPAKIRRAKAKLLKVLEAQGYKGSTVKVDVKKESDGVDVTFDVDKGEQTKIEAVRFVGNKQVSDEDLEKTLVNKKGSWLSWVPIIGDGAGKMVPAQLPLDQMRIREAYLERGYLDAKVSKPKVQIDKKTHEAIITYTIHEGKPYKVASVKILGKVPGFDPKAFIAQEHLKPGETFDVRKLRKDLRDLHVQIGDLGYAYAQIRPGFRKDSRKHTLSVAYRIDTGKKVYINDVIITGNTKTLDHVIRRYVLLSPGDPFRYTDLQETKKELQRTGFFDKVVVKPQRVSATKMNLVIQVDEAQTGMISGGIGYGSYDGFMIDGKVSEKNLFGTGIAGSLSLGYGQKSHDFSLSITDPRVFDSLYSVSFGVYDQRNKYKYDNADDNTSDYTVSRRGGWFTIGRKIGLYTHVSVGYNYSDVDYHDYIRPADIEPRYYESYKKSSLVGSITFDNTDDYYVPREGIYAKLSLEYAGLGGDAEFWRADGKFAAFYGLQDAIDYDLILRYKMHVGYMNDDGFTPMAELYTLGGSRDGVRGFSPGSIAPRYTDSNGHRYIAGGNEIFVNSIEASIPMDMVTHGMRLTGFVDYGMIRNTIYSDLDDKGWIKRASVGAQIEWRSPFGPINLVFATPINKKKGDDTAVFEFTMGGKF